MQEIKAIEVDSALLALIDQWRGSQGQTSTREEAVRRLIIAGLSGGSLQQTPGWSDGEKVIMSVLADIARQSKTRTGVDVDVACKAIEGGHFWAFRQGECGMFRSHADTDAEVDFVMQVLDMWAFIEDAFEKLNQSDRQRLAKEAAPFGAHARFRGFDGHSEENALNLVRFCVSDLGKFQRFQSRCDSLDARQPMSVLYRRMLPVFESIRETLDGRLLTADELIEILRAMGEEWRDMAAGNGADAPAQPAPQQSGRVPGARSGAERDGMKFDLEIDGKKIRGLNKRRMMLRLVSELVGKQCDPERIEEVATAVPSRKSRTIESFEGALKSEEVRGMLRGPNSKDDKAGRFFCADDELFHVGGRTYVLSNQWGLETKDVAEALVRAFPQTGIKVEPRRRGG